MNELAGKINVNGSALAALKRRLERIMRFDFVTENAVEDSAGMIIERLNSGQHVVLEFGKHGNNPTAYMLVANILTRRIYDRYQRQKEAAMGDSLREPPNLVITIEEAHRFLSSSMADQTIFGTIAREMRKYNVTLLVVDQRPSDIDEEVMSQIGTKIACLLDSGRDIDSVLSGVSGGRKLRGVLARLETRQQALVFGHAVPMPVVIRTREYGSAESYAELGPTGNSQAEIDKDIDVLFGPS
jgi:DNA helicase HerA-like ATPase